MNSRFLIIILIWASISSFNPNDKVFWDEGGRLALTDYKIKTSNNLYGKARSSIGISFLRNRTLTGIEVTVRLVFYSSNSWMHPAALTQAVLLHEQTHFDITEKNSRLLRKTINQTSIGKENWAEKLDSIYKFYLKVDSIENTLYDRETRYGNDSLKQSSWVKRNQEELNSLNTFKEIFISKVWE